MVSREDGSDVDLNQKYWKIIVNEQTGKKWHDFTATKKEMVEKTCEWLKKIKKRNCGESYMIRSIWRELEVGDEGNSDGCQLQ